MTPELVEDEALRGDFMLRWSAILLAVLLGWTEISESLTLVRIRTGEYLAEHGWLPPRTDVFSVTAADRPWWNFSWLSDLLLAGVHGLGGDVGLTVLAGVLAGISMWCVLASGRTGVSTWWGSICAVLALLAAFPLLRPGPDSFTVLGLSVLMLVLMQREDQPERQRVWLLLPVFWLWSNLDPHAFVGVAVLLAYAAGELIDARRAGSASAAKLGLFAAAAVALMLVHPFHVHILRAPLLLYRVEYPEQRLYLGDGAEFSYLWLRLTDRQFWQSLNVFSLSGLIVSLASIVALALNRRRLRWSHLLAWLAMNGLAIAAGRQLAAAGVVNAVLAAVNGQEWYRASFRQTYSVETAELLFSRGGRALTVLALFVLAYLGISGRLMGADGRRIGMGFNHEIESSVLSFQEVLADSFDDRSFNFLPLQGDVLIWLGHKPFVDSRLMLYGHGQPSLTGLHRRLRLALRQRVVGDERTGQRSLWHATFEQYGITHVLPRLSGRRPNYETFFDLLTDPEREWRLVKLGAATAAMYWNRPDNAALATYLDEHPGADFIRQAFPRTDQPEKLEPFPPIAPPREPTWYDRLLILPRDTISNDVQLARHYSQIRLLLAGRIAQDYAASLAVLTIRHARRGLVNDPSSGDAYQMLAGAYLALSEMERYLDPTGQGVTGLLRLRQLLGALHHAVTCNPDDATAHMMLYQVLLSTGKGDLALHHIQEVQRITGRLTLLPPDAPQAQEEEERNRELVTQLSTQVSAARDELRLALASDSSRLDVVQSAMNRGLPGEALRLLEEDRTVVAQNAGVQMLLADLLLDAGRAEEAVQQLEPLGVLMLQQNPTVLSRWRYATALANVVTGNYPRARELLGDDARAATETRLQSVLGTSPAPGEVPSLSTVPFTHGPAAALDARTFTRATIAVDLLLTYPSQMNRVEFTRAACHIEDGQNAEAVDLFEEVLRLDPETELRPIAAFYLGTMTGRPREFTPPSQEIPIWGGMFADDTEEGPDAELRPARDTQPAAADEASPSPPPLSERHSETAAP